MNVGSVGSASAAYVAQYSAKTPESAEPKGGVDNDGDSDNGAKAAQAASTSSVSSSTSLLGQTINVKA
jgi:hypothetical protein